MEKTTHKAYAELEKSGYDSFIGKYHYFYSSPKGEISLIQLTREPAWEIYSLKGKLFQDVERFKTKKEAENRIKDLLE